MDKAAVAQRIYEWTSGYPYLVSSICLRIETKLDRDWSEAGVDAAVKEMLKYKSTLFDDVIKNVQNNPEIKAVVWAILFEGKEPSYNLYAFEVPIMYGILAERSGKMAVANKIFEELLYGFLNEDAEVRRLADPVLDKGTSIYTMDGPLNMELLITKFAAFFKEYYRSQDENFYERHARMIFLAFIRPIVNGAGFCFVEAQTRNDMRMDVVVTYGAQKFVVELKLWRGPEYLAAGEQQLVRYLDAQGLDEGDLLTFSLGKMPEPAASATPAWREIANKRVFEVVA
jgi:hypothetical protein